jgi:hypothetical protein
LKIFIFEHGIGIFRIFRFQNKPSTDDKEDLTDAINEDSDSDSTGSNKPSTDDKEFSFLWVG